MTNQDLEDLYRSHAGLSHAAALRLVYAAGYHAGAGSDPATTAEPTYSRAKTSAAHVTALKGKIKS